MYRDMVFTPVKVVWACPCCGQDLAGIPDGCCPECGTGFTHEGLRRRLPKVPCRSCGNRVQRAADEPCPACGRWEDGSESRPRERPVDDCLDEIRSRVLARSGGRRRCLVCGSVMESTEGGSRDECPHCRSRFAEPVDEHALPKTSVRFMTPTMSQTWRLGLSGESDLDEPTDPAPEGEAPSL